MNISFKFIKPWPSRHGSAFTFILPHVDFREKLKECLFLLHDNEWEWEWEPKYTCTWKECCRGIFLLELYVNPYLEFTCTNDNKGTQLH